MNIQIEIGYRCAMVSEAICALQGITDIWYRLYVFVSACVFALRALVILFKTWGLR